MSDDFLDISPALASEIEDAVMFGKPHDIELLLENTHEGAMPADLRQGLESLHYFRSHYGASALGDMDKKKATLMDAAWAMELLLAVRTRIAAVKRA